MALHSLYCADVLLRNCSLTHYRNDIVTKTLLAQMASANQIVIFTPPAHRVVLNSLANRPINCHTHTHRVGTKQQITDQSV